MKKIKKIAENLFLFDGLNTSEISKVKRCMNELFLQKGDKLSKVGDLCKNFIFIKKGRVKVFSLSQEGKEQII